MGWILYNVGYFIQEPTYLCRIDGLPYASGGICTIENICANDPHITAYKIDKDSPDYLNNWWEKLDLQCQDKWKYQSLGSAFFIGWAVTLLWVPMLSDTRNRKKFFVSAMIVVFFAMTGILMTSDLSMMLFLMFVLGCVSSARTNIGYIYLMELVPKQHQTAVGTFWNCYNAFMVIFSPLMFWKISNNWVYLFVLGYIECIISVVASMFLPESPRLLIELGRIVEAKSSFKMIARINGAPWVWDSSHFTKDGRRYTDPKRLGTEESREEEVHTMEIMSLPPNTTTATIRQFMNDNNCAQYADDVISIGFNADMQASDHTMCFLSFHDKRIMEKVMDNLHMKELKGNLVRVRPSKMGLSEIIVDTKTNATDYNESIKTFPNAAQDTDPYAPAFLNDNQLFDQANDPKFRPNALFFLKQRWIAINLGIMSLVWLATSFNNYLLLFLTANFSDEYAIGISLGVADLLSYAVAGVLYRFLGAKWSLVTAYAISSIGGIIVVAWGLAHQESAAFVGLIFFSRIGISFAFNIIYVSHAPLFPIMFATTSFGVCNFLARIFSAFSSLFAGMSEPTPMILFTILSLITGVAVLGLQKNPHIKEMQVSRKVDSMID